MKQSRQAHVVHHFWKKESGLTSMLVLILLLNFVILPLFGSNHVVRVLTNVIWMLILLSGILSVMKTRHQAWMLSIFPLIYIILRWIKVIHESPYIVYADFILGILSVMLMITMVLIRVFEPGPVTTHRIIGSIVAYLLIGNFWAFIYHFVYIGSPGSFNVILSPPDYNSVHSAFLYFSYTTLTTTGFGDIQPVNNFVRNLVVVEQVIGVLYPIILIGRLVSLHVEKRY